MHRLRCVRGCIWPVEARSSCGAPVAPACPRCPPPTGNRRPARQCRTAIRSRSARSRFLPSHAAHAAHARAAVRPPVCTPCPPSGRACEGAIRRRTGPELCLGWPPPIRYFERSRSDAVGSSRHARLPPRLRPCTTPAHAAQQPGRRRAACRAFAVGMRHAPHRIGTSPFDPLSPTGARPPCPHFAISVTPGRPSRAQP